MKALSLSDAVATVVSSVSPLEPVEVDLASALGLVLAEPVTARDDVPLADNAGMDGYAVQAESLRGASMAAPRSLPVEKRTIFAGDGEPGLLLPGRALRIMTGALLPQGADAVVPRETVKEGEESVSFEAAAEPGQNVRRAGEDLKAGSIALARGMLMTPSALSVAAAAGASRLTVVRRPRVAVMATGDELVEPGVEPRPGQVRNLNSIALLSLLRECGATPVDLGTARDDRIDIAERLDTGSRADCLIVSAGVSAGDRDLTRAILDEMGLKTKFWRVEIKPGRPLLFGLLGAVPVFGLPGNPVSTQVAYEVFVRPALLAMMGRSRCHRPVHRVILAEEIRRAPGRPELVRVKLERSGERMKALPTRSGQGSGISTSMLNADGLLFVEAETVFIPRGESAPCIVWREGEEAEFGLPRVSPEEA